VERNQSSGGGDIIHVQIDIGEHLEYLHDVNVNSRTTNDLLIYNGTVWTNYARTNLNSIYLPLAGGTMAPQAILNANQGTITNLANIFGASDVQGYIDFPQNSPAELVGNWTFDSQPTIPGYLTVTGAAATYVELDNLPAGIVTTNNLSTIAGSGLGVTSNQLVVTNVAGTVTTNMLTNYLALAGGTMGGNLNMNSNSITSAIEIQAEGIAIPGGGTRIDIKGLEFLETWTFESQPIIPGYLTTNSLSAYLTVTAGNANYWRITTAPTGATSSGSSGQMAVDGTNLFIYSPNALGTGTARWIRVSGSATW
jgi:hypothetical protein